MGSRKKGEEKFKVNYIAIRRSAQFIDRGLIMDFEKWINSKLGITVTIVLAALVFTLTVLYYLPYTNYAIDYWSKFLNNSK